MSTERSDQLFRVAQALLPGGVDSPVRAFHSVGGTPRFIARDAAPPSGGNVPTRVKKALAADGPYDAIVLAAAGLDRLGLSPAISERFALERLLPAPGQGAIALQCRADHPVRELVHAINHDATWAAVTAERAFLAGLEGGCAAPVAAYARLDGGTLVLQGLVASGDGKKVLRFATKGAPSAAESLGRALAERALAAGAAELMPG